MIGDRSTVSGFAAGGVVGYAIAESREALDLLRELVKSKEYAIIYITERLAESILSEISAIETGAVPAIIIIPDQSGTREIGFKRIRLSIEKALGIDVLGKED